jgi:type II secretory pathway predicted ATPase ExeA
MLDSRELRQLRQRIGVRWRLDALSTPEAGEYVRHRLRVAAGAAAELFSPAALRELRRRSRGVPRLVNLLADRALLAGYADRSRRVERVHVGRAAREILAARRRRRSLTRPRWTSLRRSGASGKSSE